jgi:allantoin racemase
LNELFCGGDEKEMRILVVHQQYPEAERRIRQDACLKAASPGTTIEFVEISAGRMIKGDSLSTELFSALAAPEVVEQAQMAEKSGIDAVVPLGTLDLGVDAATKHVNIPVVGAGRTGYHLAASLRARIGVIVYEESAVGHAWRIARECGVASAITSIRAVGIPTREMSSRRAELKRGLLELARKQIDDEGAEVLFPQGISLVPVHFAAGELASELGIPVIDGLTASIRVAEFLVFTGYRSARQGVRHQGA